MIYGFCVWPLSLGIFSDTISVAAHISGSRFSYFVIFHFMYAPNLAHPFKLAMFLVVDAKLLTKQLQQEGFILAYSLRVQSLMVERRDNRCVGQLATLSLQLGSGGQGMSYFHLVQELNQGMVPPTSRVGLPCLTEFFWK